MAFHKPNKIAELAIEAGVTKAGLSRTSLLVLGFLGGAYISLGFLLDIRVIGNMPQQWGSFSNFLGAAVFPIGLILLILGGGELITGNMMALAISAFARKISLRQLARNWFWVTISNFLGALFVAFFFGHLVGLTETGPYLTKTVAIAQAKIDESFWHSFISAIGCNWLVCLAVWLAYGAEDFAGKIIGIWFPVMTFVAIGFQHVVANMFVIPAAIFAGAVSWTDFAGNIISVFLGNMVGGSVFVALFYYVAYTKPNAKQSLSSHSTTFEQRLRNIN